jgi:hypothetical protein
MGSQACGFTDSFGGAGAEKQAFRSFSTSHDDGSAASHSVPECGAATGRVCAVKKHFHGFAILCGK